MSSTDTDALLERLSENGGDLEAADAYTHETLDAIRSWAGDTGISDAINALSRAGVPKPSALGYIKYAERHDDGHTLYGLTDLQNLPDPTWLADGMVEERSLAVLFGPSGSGKTFVALDLALSVAFGARWLDSIEVEQGPVVYVAGEGAHGIKTRVQAWRTARDNENEVAPFSLFNKAVNLFKPPKVTQFMDGVHARHRDGVALVVFDTLNRCTLGAEENSASDMAQVVESADYVKRKLGASVLIIHHTGKDVRRGARGSNALRAAVDTELRLKSGAVPELRCDKQKNAAEFSPVTLNLEEVGLSLVPRQASAVDALDEDVVQDVYRVLTEADESLSQTAVVDAVGGKASKVRETLTVLASDPEHGVQVEDGPRNAKLYSLSDDQRGWGNVTAAA